MTRRLNRTATGATVAFGPEAWHVGPPAGLDAAPAALDADRGRRRTYPHPLHRCSAPGTRRGQEDTMSMTIPTPAGLRRLPEHTAAEQRLAAGWEQLTEQTEPGQRAATLLRMSADEQLCATLHAAAYGTPAGPRLQGPADRDSSAALMLLWLATTEVLSAHAGGRAPAAPMAEAIAAANYPTPWPAAQPLLDRLCLTTDPATRARLVEGLYAELVGAHGYDVAAVLDSAYGAYSLLATGGSR